MLRAAILARKSTDDNDKNEDNKSVTRQVERGRAYIAAKGWTLDDVHIYVDDDVSGAEFKNRPGLLRLLNHLKEIDVIVMSEFSRLGREQSHTGTVLAQIHGAGARIFFYLTDEELRYESALDKFMAGAVSFAAELEREKASQRARDALSRKAEKGYNTGGRVYGYDNVPVYGAAVNGQQVRIHTDYRIHPEEAEVVRGIFRACADGRGLTAIAKALNGDPAYKDITDRYFASQRQAPPRKGTGSWAPSSVREILHRPRYTGKVPFGEYRKVLRAGTQARVRQASYMLIERPDLRIVPDDLWRAVQARLQTVRVKHGHLTSARIESKYLLSGLMRCEHCGGAMVATSMVIGTPGHRRKVMRYACSFAKNRGATVCTNTVRPAMQDLDGQVLDAIEGAVLTPAALRRVLDLVLERAREARRAKPGRERVPEAEAKRVRQELDRLIALVVSGRAPARVLEEIASRETRLEEIKQTAATERAAEGMGEIDLRRVEAMAIERFTDFQTLMRSNAIEGRHALRQLLDGPIAFQALDDGRYRFHGATRLGPLLRPTSLSVASPRGFEPLLPP